MVAVVAIALGMATAARLGQPQADLSSPEGVATTFVIAIQNREPDKAWGLLASPSALSGPFPGPGRDSAITQENFRQQVLNSSRSGNRRVRVLGSQVNGDAARVDIETTFVDSGPFGFGSSGNPQTRAFELKQMPDGWRITTAPSLFDLL